MSESRDVSGAEKETPAPGGLDWVAGVGSDWWATIVGLAVTALAVAGALPRIPW